MPLNTHFAKLEINRTFEGWWLTFYHLCWKGKQASQHRCFKPSYSTQHTVCCVIMPQHNLQLEDVVVQPPWAMLQCQSQWTLFLSLLQVWWVGMIWHSLMVSESPVAWETPAVWITALSGRSQNCLMSSTAKYKNYWPKSIILRSYK